MWRIVTTESSLLALISFVEAAHEGVFMSETADPRIVADGLGVLVSMPEFLAVGLLTWAS